MADMKPSKSTKSLEHAAELDPSDAGTYAHIMELGADLGDQQKVDGAYSALHSIDPDLADEIKDALTS